MLYLKTELSMDAHEVLARGVSYQPGQVAPVGERGFFGIVFNRRRESDPTYMAQISKAFAEAQPPKAPTLEEVEAGLVPEQGHEKTEAKSEAPKPS